MLFEVKNRRVGCVTFIFVSIPVTEQTVSTVCDEKCEKKEEIAEISKC